MFAAGLAVPLAVARGVGPRRALNGLLWAGAARARPARRGRARRRCAALQRRGRDRADRPERRAGPRHGRPVRLHDLLDSRASMPSSRSAARCSRSPRPARATPAAARSPGRATPRAAWAIAYALGVRLYQGLGGTVGHRRHVRGPGGDATGEPARRRLDLRRRRRRAGVRPPVGPAPAALAGDRPGAGRLGVRDGARADRVRHQAAGRARRGAARVPRLGGAPPDARSSSGTCCSTSPGSSASGCSSRSARCTTTGAPAASTRAGCSPRPRRRRSR